MALKSEKGQTIVEYILLMVVAFSLVLTFYNSTFFKSIFGKDGKLGQKAKSQAEFAYRHGFQSTEPDIPVGNRDINIHPTYSDQGAGTTRFFGPKMSYP